MNEKKKEQLENLKTKIEGIGISRVPARTKREFKDLAEAEFCSDYGMTLKWLIDQAKESGSIEVMAAKLLELDHRVSLLETTPKPKEEKQTRKLLDGRKIKIPNKEEENDGKI